MICEATRASRPDARKTEIRVGTSIKKKSRERVCVRFSFASEPVYGERNSKIVDLLAISKKLKPNEKILMRIYSQGRSGYVALEPK